MKRILIIGISCSGKTTVGRKLSKKLNIPFHDLDDLYWNPGWIETDKEKFKNSVTSLCKEESWIIVGNYNSVQSLVLEECDTVIWLNLSRARVWYQALVRSMRRILFSERCCNGNIESFQRTFLTKESILLWVLKDYKRKYIKYSNMRDDGEFSKKEYIELRNTTQINNLLIKE